MGLIGFLLFPTLITDHDDIEQLLLSTVEARTLARCSADDPNCATVNGICRAQLRLGVKRLLPSTPSNPQRAI